MVNQYNAQLPAGVGGRLLTHITVGDGNGKQATGYKGTKE